MLHVHVYVHVCRFMCVYNYMYVVYLSTLGYTCMLLLQLIHLIKDIIGTSKRVLLMELSFVDGSNDIVKYQNGTSL